MGWEEWSYFVCHQGRVSWIRITDVPLVHGRDDLRLLSLTPVLGSIGGLLRTVEKQHGLSFSRKHALIRTNIASAESAIRTWVSTF